LAATNTITLLENPVNLGFVSSVNRGMTLHPDRDVVLLNSDTEVHGDWLDRLRRCADQNRDVGTVTPFSNNATICSYPRFNHNNRLPNDWSLAALDDLFAEVNAGQALEIPTAVGFCMYITRRCLYQVGYFDALRFKQGYGEENDFCMRATDLGFRHFLCADTFVYHHGNVSFGDKAEALCAAAQQVLHERHPHYGALVGDFCAKDPLRIVRRHIDTARLKRSQHQRLLFITHTWGGGTEKHVQDLAMLLQPHFEVFILRPTGLQGVSVQWGRSGEEFIVYFRLPYAYPELVEFLKTLGIFYIHIHHIIELNQQILQLPQDLAVSYDVTVHDYYPICPQINLLSKAGRYCGEPDTGGCTACLTERPALWGLDILSWRTFFKNLLVNANRVFVPSKDVLLRMESYIPGAHYIYLSHPEFISTPSLNKVSLPQGELKILILGALTIAKGLKLLEACAIDAKRRKLPLFFQVIGYPVDEFKKEPEIPLSFHGRYEDEQLPLLIARERADIIFFPALWPETYSYTLSYAIDSGLPIAAPKLGAFQERLAEYPGASLLDWDTSAERWNDFFASLVNAPPHNPELITRMNDGA
jgi:GT2 family glycosyltransferase